ncbi:MAG: adenylosuccinate synthase [Anaerolineales bacterium]|nr:adenylosuccinate synthase [Anaerolineales bacterium]
MPLHIIVGAQWGDEGKGRITDLLAAEAAVVARYSGGDNAGHTVTVEGSAGPQIFKLHLLPSGLIHSHVVGVLGHGMVINPRRLLDEIEQLRALGVPVSPERLKISAAAHLLTPGHVALDRAEEAARAAGHAEGKLGTTGRGIGPAYTDKTARRGLRAENLLDPERLGDRVAEHVRQVNQTLERLYGAPGLDPAQVAADYTDYARRLAPYLTETSLYLHERLRHNAAVLAEGAQGTLLDLDLGTYPFVTSSSPTSAGAFVGLGVGPQWAGRIVGVTKVFQTRVGAGPFPTETFGLEAERLRGTGANPWDEFGTTTGRPRRCGWLDLVLLRYAVRVNGLTELVLTKMDVLSGLDEVRLCTAYAANGAQHAELPLGPADLAPFQPVYETMPGWREDLSGARTLADLPAAARHYVRRIEELTGVPVSLISVGPERSQIVRAE